MKIRNSRIDFVIYSILSSITLGEDILAEVKCETHPVGYIVPDPTYCDRYLLCKPSGQREIQVCEQGLKFDFNSAGCAPEKVVMCGERSKSWRNEREDPGTQKDYIRLKRVESPALVTAPPTPKSAPQAQANSDPLADVVCRGDATYIVPDPIHCDRLLSCPSGLIEVCNPGLALDLVTGLCLLRSQVDCGRGRVKLFSDEQRRRVEEERKSPSRVDIITHHPNVDLRRPLTQPVKPTPEVKLRNHERVQDALGLLLREAERQKVVRERRPASGAAPSHNERNRGTPGPCRGLGTYTEADPDQCDKYTKCEAGRRSVHLCPDGLGFSVSKSQCDLLIKVDCGLRLHLQPPGPRASSLCPRETGLYALEDRCDRYVDCREGKQHFQDCAPGTVFDQKIGNCVHPDQTQR